MADRFWVGGTGSWTTSNTANWSTTSGGTSGASVPGTSDVAIFDANSGSGNYTVTKTSNSTVSGLIMNNPSGGILTFAGTSTTGVSGNDGISIGATVNWTNTANLNITGTPTMNITTNGNAIASPISISSGTPVVTMTGAVSTTKQFSIGTSCTLNFNNYNITCDTFSLTSTTARVLNFGTGVVNITSTTTGATVLSMTGTSLSVTGSRTFNIVGSGSATRTISLTGLDETNAPDINITSGSGTVTMAAPTFRSLNMTGSTSAFSITGATTIYGNLTLSSSNYPSGSTATNFASSSAGNTIKLNGRSMPGSVTFNGTGEWILQDAFTSTGTSVTLTSGTLNLNNFSFTAVTFLSNNTNARSINFGTSGVINITGTSTVWNTSSVTNLSIFGNSAVNITDATTTTKTITPGTPTESNSISFNFTGAGAATLNVTAGSAIKNLNFTGSTGSWSNTGITIYGSLTLSTGMTVTAGTNTVTFASTSAGRTIRTNGKTMGFPVNFNGTGGSWTLSDNMTVGSNIITLTAGTLNTAGFSLTSSVFTTQGSSTKNINFSNSTIIMSGTGATIPWDIGGSNNNFNFGTSTLQFSGVSPTFNGLGFSYYNVSFTNAAVSSISINGQNSYNTLLFTVPTSVGYVPVTFSDNQTISNLTINGTLVGNFRFFFQSSVQDTQRTLSVSSLTGFGDIDFRDIVTTGSASPLTGTRLGDAGNNSGITFATPKTVFWSTASASSGGNWSSANWSTVSAGTAGVSTSFPLPQDTVSVASGNSGFSLQIDRSYNIGNFTCSLSNGGLRSLVTQYFLGNINFSGFGTGGSAFGTGTAVFYNRTGATQTITLNLTNSGNQWAWPVIIDTTGTVQVGTVTTAPTSTLTNTWYSSSSLTINRGTFDSQNKALMFTYLDSQTTNTRSILLGSTTMTLSYSTDNSKGFVVNTSGLTFNAGTSTITFSGSRFAIISDGNITFNNINFTSNAGAFNKLIGSRSYINNESSMNTIDISANNITSSGNTTALSCSIIQFSGVSNLTLSGTLTITPGSGANGRQFWMSNDVQMIVTAPAVGTFADTDFSGIIAAGASAPWSGTRLGNAGRNNNITFPAAKTVYYVSTTAGNVNWYNTANWSNTSGGTANLIYFPLAHDTAVIDDVSMPASVNLAIGFNYCLPFIDFSSRTAAMTLNNNNGTMIATPASITLRSNITWSASAPSTWYLTGSSTQTIDMAGKTFLQPLIIVSGSTIQLQSAFTSTNTSGVTLVDGELNLNGFTMTTPYFGMTTPETKSLTFATSSTIAITGNSATVLSIPVSSTTNFSSTGTSNISLTYSGSVGTRTVDTVGINVESKSLSINVTAGTDILSIGTSTTSSGVKNLNLQGFSGTWVHPSPLNLYGNLTVGTTVATIQDVSTNYIGSSSSTITSSGKTLRGRLVVNSSSGSLAQADNLVLTQFSGGQISYLQLSKGTFSANGFNTTIDRLLSSGSDTRTLDMGSGSWNVTATDDSSSGTIVWNMATNFGLTVASSSSTLTLSGSGTKTFNGGSKTYNNVSISGSDQLTILGTNTFNTMSNSIQPITVLFEGNNSQSFSNFNLSGTAGNLVTIGSTTAIPSTLYKSSAWNVGANSVNGGGNTGLTFTAGSNDYLSISNITGTNVAPLPPAIRLSGLALSGGYTITV